MVIEIVDLPSKQCDFIVIFHRFVYVYQAGYFSIPLIFPPGHPDAHELCHAGWVTPISTCELCTPLLGKLAVLHTEIYTLWL